MATIAPSPKFVGLDSNGDPLASGKLYTYTAGTTTAKDTYTTQAGSVANANPVILDSRGEADVWLSGAYKFVLKDSADVTIWTVDNLGTVVSGSTASKTGEYTVTSSDDKVLLLCNASGGAFSVLLPAATGLTAGFSVTIKKIDSSSNAVTIDPSTSETVEDVSTWAIDTQYESVTITTDSVEWFIRDRMIVDGINDANGNEILKIVTTASAVNEVTLTNAATSGLPIIAASGGDTNVGLVVRGKGTGRIDLGTSTSTELRLVGDQPITDSSGNEYIKFSKTASAVNELTITNAAADGIVSLAATGGDTHIQLNINAKGTDPILSTSPIDFVGSSYLRIPSGAGGTTIDATGKICVDTTSKTFNYYNGTAETVLDPQLSKAASIENPSS